MSKSKFLIQKFADNKSNIALVCVLIMMAGCIFSRALLSVATILFGLNALWNINPKYWFRNKWWLVGAGWVMFYVITYFWSSNLDYWNIRFQVKLPVLLLPLSFAFLPPFSRRQMELFIIVTGFLLLGGVCYSTSFFIRHPLLYMEKYRISQVLPTPMGQDHIRFSLTLALFIIWSICAWPNLQNKLVKWLTVLFIILFIIYLHILAAKTGLLAIYLFFIGWGIYIAFSRKKIVGLGIILALVLFIGLAVRYIPTFRQRIGYMSYTYIVFKEGDQSGEYGDIGRLMSYDIALKLIGQHPWTGVGTGDMLDEMKKGYDKWYPQVADENRLLPANQFLTVALGCGIPLTVVFAIWAFMPLAWLRRNRESFFLFIVWLVLFIQLLIEPVLEVQYGVFVYLFFLLWQKHLLPAKQKEY